MSIWDAFRRPAPPAAVEEEKVVCALCGMHRGVLRRLIAGERGAVCVGCTPRMLLAFLDTDGPAVWIDLVKELPSTHRVARSRPLLAAALAWAEDDRERREIAQEALRLHDPISAREALESIVEAERTTGDRLNLGYAAWLAGDRARALAAIEGIDEEELPNDEETGIWNLNRASSLMLGEPSDDDLDQAARDNDAARRSFESMDLESPRRLSLLSSVMGTAAEIALHRGEPDRALTLLPRDRDVLGAGWYRRMLRGDAYAALGDTLAAREEWTTELAKAPPDSRLAELLRDRIEEFA